MQENNDDVDPSYHIYTNSFSSDKFTSSKGNRKPDEQPGAEYEATEVTLTIFAKTQMEIDSTISKIESMCDSEVVDKILREEVIRELSPRQVNLDDFL